MPLKGPSQANASVFLECARVQPDSRKEILDLFLILLWLCILLDKAVCQSPGGGAVGKDSQAEKPPPRGEQWCKRQEYSVSSLPTDGLSR